MYVLVYFKKLEFMFKKLQKHQKQIKPLLYRL